MKTFVRTLIIATLLALALTGSAFSATRAGSKATVASELPKWECIHCGKSVKSATKPAPDFCPFSYWSEEHDWVRVQ